jgi:hypothetical protein
MVPSTTRITEPSPALLRAVREELRQNLPEAQRPLLELLGVYDFLTAITVAHGERAAGRMIQPFAKLEPAIELLRGLGLRVRRAGFDFMSTSSGIDGTDHQRAVVPRGAPGGTHGMVYLALTEEFVEGAEAVERAGQHGVLGQLFGYPECCTRIFLEPSGHHLDKTADSIPDVGPFPRDLNPCTPYLHGLNLLFHFPCSPTCQPSRELLAHRRGYLEGLAPSAVALRGLGAGLALYGPELGIAQVTRWRREGDELLVEEVLTRSEQSCGLFSRAAAASAGPVRLRVRSRRAVDIGAQRVEGERNLVAWFE